MYICFVDKKKNIVEKLSVTLVFFHGRRKACERARVTWKETWDRTKLKMAIMMKYQHAVIQQPFSVDKELDQRGESDIQLVCKCNWSQLCVFYHCILAGWTHAGLLVSTECFACIVPKLKLRVGPHIPENTHHATHAVFRDEILNIIMTLHEE